MGKADPKLLEMAEVFHIPSDAKMKYIVLPAKWPELSKRLRAKDAAKADKIRQMLLEGDHR